MDGDQSYESPNSGIGHSRFFVEGNNNNTTSNDTTATVEKINMADSEESLAPAKTKRRTFQKVIAKK